MKTDLKKTIKNAGSFLYSRFFLQPDCIPDLGADVFTVTCRGDEARVLTGSTNNVIEVSIDGKSIYFRECRAHTDMRSYIRQLIEDYYSEVAPEDASDKAVVEKIFKSPAAFFKFTSMGVLYHRHSAVRRFFLTNDSAAVGIRSESKEQTERLKRFVQYAWGDIYSYHLNGSLKKGLPQVYNAVRELETRRIAEILGLEAYVPEVRYGILRVEGQREKFGTVMEPAPGICMSMLPVEDRIAVVSPRLQHSLNNLNLLDVMCHEKDHRPCNYNVLLKDGKAASVSAFDNDSPMCLSRSSISYTTYKRCSPWAEGETLNRPFIDAALAERVLKLSETELMRGSYCNCLQKRMLIKRFRAVKRVIENCVRQNPQCLLKDNEWNENTVNTELSRRWGRTYLCLFTEEQNISPKLWMNV